MKHQGLALQVSSANLHLELSIGISILPKILVCFVDVPEHQYLIDKDL